MKPGLNRARAEELLAAFEIGGTSVEPPSARDPEFDMNAAYAVEAEFARLRVVSGRTLTGRKVGYANKAMWRVLKLETLVWAHMYDDTVRYANEEFSLARCGSPKIEPEIVFKLKRPIVDAASVLEAVEWMAIGFEIIDCPYPGWQFKPVDFVAGFGLHKGLIVGQPVHIESASIPDLPAQLASFKVRLLKNGELVDEGSGKNSLKSPALCLAELATATPLAAGEIISTGTLTTAQPIAAGEVWTVEAVGLSVPNLTLRLN